MSWMYFDMVRDVLVFALWLLGVARISRFLVQEKPTDFIREWVFTKYGETSFPGYLSVCPWCISVWVGLTTAPYLMWLTGWPWLWYPIIVLAASQIAGMLSQFRDDDINIEIVEDDKV